MNRNSFSMMQLYFFSLIFIVAISLGVYLFTITSKTIDKAYDMRADHNQATVLQIVKPYVVEGSDVLSILTLIKDIGCEIVVDGVTFPPSLDITETDVSIVDAQAHYNEKLTRDQNGKLIQVRYTSM
ncbi:hypothetical protein QYF50_06660 [Paenibacillus vini]|uniref:hypothetical protein n=1 Tax=Paenibacillus vini TaxID=1476024 RepID=UPI0025B70B97|nr:hypothetical protein [Paenibacillus vini]MDN4067573.1 hypothetical protein [Paenibacillus vini]